MKICIVSPNTASLFFQDLPPTHGGGEVQLYFYAQQLSKNPEIELHYILQKNSKHDEKKVGNIYFHYIDLRPGLKCKFELQLLMAKINADVYIQRCHGSITKEVAFFKLWRRKKFVYWVASNYDVDPTIETVEYNRSSWFIWGMKQADMVLVQMENQLEKLKKNYGKDGVIVRNSFPEMETETNKKKQILWVGRFIPLKRPEYLMEIAKAIPNCDFIMIAPVGRGISKQHYDKFKDEIPSISNLKHIKGLPMKEMESYYRESKLVINTSTYEGFPNTFLQAMISGTSIGSLDFDPDQIISKRNLGIAPTNDLNKFIEKIKDFLGSEELQNQQKQNCLEYANQFHNLEKNTNTLFSTLKTLLN